MGASVVDEVLVVDVQRFSLHDGPGIRTTVFLKGCPLRCLWCQNPEAVRREPEIAVYPERCQHSARCRDVCPQGAIRLGALARVDFDRCSACGACARECAHDAIRLIGRRVPVDELVGDLLRDLAFFEDSGGGVTFSGGEPLVQAPALGNLLARLSDRGVHTAIETCGLFPWSRMAPLLSSLDLVYFDVKHMDSAIHRRLTGRGNELILANFARLANSPVELVARMPVVPGFNDDEENVRATADLLRAHGLTRIHLLGYHGLGEAKKPHLDSPLAPFHLATMERRDLEKFARRFEERGIDVTLYD